MITLRKSEDRGHANHGWLDSHFSFSFADYHDPACMGFRSLRVINEDFIQPGTGFGTHPHQDMEIITYVLQGAVQHKDSMGNGSVIRPGEVQRMTAGTGITHSEFNPSDTELLHLLQIWIVPQAKGLEPGYEQRSFSERSRQNQLRLVASSDGRDDSVLVHQDMRMHACLLAAGKELSHELAKGRGAWLQVCSGSLSLNGHALAAGDGAAVEEEGELLLRAETDCELLLFDLT